MIPKTEHELLLHAEDILNEGLRKELRDQGHYLTGALERSIKGVITASGGYTQLTGWSLGYGRDLQTGLGPDEMPFYGQGPDGSKYQQHVENLYKYFMLRGLPPDEAKVAAKRTAKIHARSGMPTPGSYQFADNGKRTGYITETEEGRSPFLNRVISTGMDHIVSNTFNETKSETI